MIQLHKVSCRFDKNYILKDLDLDLAPNTIHTVVAPNGTGKTTLFGLLADLNIPTSGTIDYQNGFSKKDVVLLLAGDKNLYMKNTVKENVYFFGILRGLSKKEIEKNITFYKKMFPQYDEFQDKLTEILSYGQKRIVALFSAIVSESKCIILDEAAEGLDISNLQVLKELLQEAKKDRIIILASHDFYFCSEISDQIYYLKEGQIITKGSNLTRDQLFEEYQKLFG